MEGVALTLTLTLTLTLAFAPSFAETGEFRPADLATRPRSLTTVPARHSSPTNAT